MICPKVLRGRKEKRKITQEHNRAVLCFAIHSAKFVRILSCGDSKGVALGIAIGDSAFWKMGEDAAKQSN